MTDNILSPAPKWEPPRRDLVRLWHGCRRVDAESILSRGVDLTFSRDATDFGRGFYTTTVKRQSTFWAWERSARRASATGFAPTVLWIDLDRRAMASLDMLAFGDAHVDAQDYWSFVQHCRTVRIPQHHGGPSRLYDIVIGPVAGFWRQRLVIPACDQVSFHTQSAVDCLNHAIQTPGRVGMERVANDAA